MSKTQEMKKLRQDLAKLHNTTVIGSSITYSSTGACFITLKFLNGNKLIIKPKMFGIDLDIELKELG